MKSSNDIVISEAKYILKHNATVRDTGKHFGRSKSTIHTDMRVRLSKVDKSLASEVAKVLDANLADRHNRGGRSTKEKWQRIASKNIH